MTRINSSVKVRLLTDEHLLAEHREIKRLPSVYKKRLDSNKGFNDVPLNFTLGTGHVLFFINKGKFTLDRYLKIREECIKRGFQVEDYSKNWSGYDKLNDYTPTDTEHYLLVERITERLKNTKKPYWHYYGKQISKEQSINLIKET